MLAEKWRNMMNNSYFGNTKRALRLRARTSGLFVIRTSSNRINDSVQKVRPIPFVEKECLVNLATLPVAATAVALLKASTASKNAKVTAFAL